VALRAAGLGFPDLSPSATSCAAASGAQGKETAVAMVIIEAVNTSEASEGLERMMI